MAFLNEEDLEELELFGDGIRGLIDECCYLIKKEMPEEDYETYCGFNDFDPEKYGSDEYIYSHIDKATDAGKEAIKRLLYDVDYDIEVNAETYCDELDEHCFEMKDYFNEYMKKISEEYDLSASKCSEEVKSYLMDKKEKFMSSVDKELSFTGYSENRIGKILAESFKDSLLFDIVYPKCEFDQIDDDYAYNLESVCGLVNEKTKEIIGKINTVISPQYCDEYMNALLEELDKLVAGLDEIIRSE